MRHAPERIELKTRAQIASMRAAGLVVAQGLAAMRDAVAPGVSTADLDAIGPPPWEPSDADDEAGEVRVWTPAWQLGLPLGHLAVHLH